MQVEQAPQEITAPMSVAIGVLVRMPPVAKQTTGWTHRCEGREWCWRTPAPCAWCCRMRRRASPPRRGVWPCFLLPQRIADGSLRWTENGESRSLACPLTDAEREMAMTTLPDASRRGLWLVLLAALCCALLPAAGMAAGVPAVPCRDLAARRWPDQPLVRRECRRYHAVSGCGAAPAAQSRRAAEELTPIGEVRNPTAGGARVRLALAPGQRAPITLKELARPESPQVWRGHFGPGKNCWWRMIRAGRRAAGGEHRLRRVDLSGAGAPAVAVVVSRGVLVKPICDAFLSCCALLGLLGAGQTAMAQGYEYFDAGVVSYVPSIAARSDASNFHFNFSLGFNPSAGHIVGGTFLSRGLLCTGTMRRESH